VKIELILSDRRGRSFVVRVEEPKLMPLDPRDNPRTLKIDGLRDLTVENDDGSFFRFVPAAPWPHTFRQRLRWLLAWRRLEED
jgi:hypothetical protein